MSLITPPDVPQPIGSYSALWEVELDHRRTLVTFSGLVGVDADGRVGATVEEQLQLVFAGLEQVLAHYGAAPGAVGKLLTFLRDDVPFGDYAQARSAIYERLYPDGGYPAHSLAKVSALAAPELLVEVEGMLLVEDR
ncbi:MAG TPA: Rid family hydrolase [Egicoccus sp.]|nr:Rid family hydrolase [Egicoccus sp.]HSK24607.1 Rid family hydrolase [Egicoccus sp.]